MEQTFAALSALINRAAALISDQIRRLEKGHEDYVGMETDDADAAVRIFRVRSLVLFRDTLEYLSRELVRTDESAYFLLPHIRTLMDVLARFIHLEKNCDTLDKQALTCVGYQLLLASALGEEQYQSAKGLVSKLLARTKFSFPTSASGMSVEELSKHNLHFPKRKKLLTKENLYDLSRSAREVFGIEKTYEIYGYISEYVHGNPYYYTGVPHNERYWVAALATQLGAFQIELIDRYALGRENTRDFRVWLGDIKEIQQSFLNEWRQAKH